MDTITQLLDDSIAYHGGSEARPDVPDETWCVVIEFADPNYMEFIKTTFESNFDAPFLSTERALIGRCLYPNRRKADGIAHHINSILDHFEAQQRLTPFSKTWLSNALTNHRMGIINVDVQLERAPIHGDFQSRLEHLGKQHAKRQRQQKTFDALCATSVEDVIDEWMAFLHSNYPDLSYFTSLEKALKDLSNSVIESATAYQKVFRSHVQSQFRLILNTLIAQDASLDAVSSAESEKSRFFSHFSHELEYGLRLPCLPELQAKSLKLIDDLDRRLSKGMLRYYEGHKFSAGPSSFSAGPDSVKDLWLVLERYRLADLSADAFGSETLGQLLIQLFVTQIYASEVAKRTQAMAEYLEAFSSTMTNKTVVHGLTDCLTSPMADLKTLKEKHI